MIISENYPGNYPNNFNKNYTINAEDAILITFSDFDLEVHRFCSYDWLMIVDGDGSTLLSKTCGSDIPAPVRTNTNTAVIIFHSDRSENFRGFNITWELSPSDTTCEPCSDCNSEQSKCEATSGCNFDASNEVCVPDIGCYCGEAKRNQNGRIAAGTETEVNEYPWLALVRTQRRDNSGRLSTYICGGSVISDQWVLTAAHCVVDDRKGDVVRVSVELGQHHRNTDAIIEVLIPLAQVIIHPDYRSPRGSSNDLALLKLDDPVDFNNVPDVRPVCLPSDRDERFTGLRVTVAGWGRTAPNEGSSNVPLETEVNVISDSTCKETYGSRISDDMICTISPRDGAVFQGSCKGDSGGPLMITDERNPYYTLIGAVSWGWEPCTSQRVPGVHSRITSNMDWITETIAGTSTCPSRTGGK